jgi:hypothetical protein
VSADTPQVQLAAVLRDARALAADDEHIVAEIDRHLEALRHGPLPKSAVAGLFLPTGPLQEESLYGGWGDEFLTLADRFDAI